jgi:hypothetical protein
LKSRRRRNNFWKNTADIPTGAVFDIHKQIERQREKRAVAPDNLAPPPPDNLVKDVPANLGWM